MIRWVFKWLLRLTILAVLLVVIFLLSLDSILRTVIEHNIHAQTGMDAEIGRVRFGLLEPTMEIQDLKIYNPPSFGGTPFLDIPDIYVEYNRAALAKKQLHLTLLRLNLAELDIVKGQNGSTNIFTFGKTPGEKSSSATPGFKKQTGYVFKQIDELNVSFKQVKYIDLQDSRNDRQQIIGIDNWVIRDVKSPNDLTGLALFIDLRSNHFFDPFIGKPQNSGTLQSILNLIGVSL